MQKARTTVITQTTTQRREFGFFADELTEILDTMRDHFSALETHIVNEWVLVPYLRGFHTIWHAARRLELVRLTSLSQSCFEYVYALKTINRQMSCDQLVLMKRIINALRVIRNRLRYEIIESFDSSFLLEELDVAKVKIASEDGSRVFRSQGIHAYLSFISSGQLYLIPSNAVKRIVTDTVSLEVSEKTSYVDHASVVDGQFLFILDFSKLLGSTSLSRLSSLLLVEVLGLSFLLRVEQLSQVYSVTSGEFKERSSRDASHVSGYFESKNKNHPVLDLNYLATKIPQ